MNNPLKTIPTVSESTAPVNAGQVIPMKFVIYKTGRSLLSVADKGLDLAHFKFENDTEERKFSDYLLLGILALLLHVYVVQRYQDLSHNLDSLTPVKVPPMVEITLTPPPPPPKPIVQPPPPPPPPPPKKVEPIKKAEPPPPKKDVVALKPKPVKPKPLPRPVERVVEREDPTPAPSHVADDPPPSPVHSAPTAPPAPPAEKVTPPSASAGYLHNPAPAYPSIAEEEGWEGRVLLKVHVMPNGRADVVTVAKSSGHGVLDEAAVHVVRSSWHFVPAKRGETPIEGWVTVPISFHNPG